MEKQILRLCNDGGCSCQTHPPWLALFPPTVIIKTMLPTRPSASIVVPTFREAANLKTLIERIFAVTQKERIQAEVIVVDDDSRDGTEQLVKSLMDRYPVRLLVRKEQRDLSGAVLAGFRLAAYDSLVVLDADLQHPPEVIPAMLEALHEPGCDFVIGTRYGSGGGIETDWPMLRRITSRVATWLARPLVPLSDPLSGYFALPRRIWEEAAPLDPIGYKIALELYVKGGCRHPREVPIRFAQRIAGESKLSLAIQLRFLRHLASLYWFRFPRLIIAISLLILGVAATAFLFTVIPTRGELIQGAG